MRRLTRGVFWTVVTAALCCGGAQSRAAGPASKPTTQKAQVDLSSVATEAQSVSITLRQMEADAAADRMTPEITAQLPTLTAEIDARIDESSKLLASPTSLQLLEGQKEDWGRTDKELTAWKEFLGRRRQLFSDQRHRLDELGGQWGQSRDVAAFYADHASNADTRSRLSDTVAAVDDVVQSIRQTDDDLHAQLIAVFTLQQQVDAQDARVRDVQESVREAQNQAWDRLFQRDGVPVWALWKPTAASAKAPSVAQQGQGTFERQTQAVTAYMHRRRANVAMHVGLIVALAALLFWAHRRLRVWAAEDPGLRRATEVFARPIATAIILSFLASIWIYPHAPRLFWAGIGLVSLIPTVLILRRLIERRLFTLLDSLVVFYVFDQVRVVIAAVPILPRLLFLVEMLGGVLLLWSFVRESRAHPVTDRFGRIVRLGVRVWLAVFAAAFVLDSIGNVSLGELIGDSALAAAYLAVILYATTVIVDALMSILLRVRPLVYLEGVQRFRSLILHRLNVGVEWLAIAFWAWAVLQSLDIWARVYATALYVWNLHLQLGGINLDPARMVVFGLTVWASFLLSRFLQFVLNEDVYNRLSMDTGLTYAANRVLHYTVLLVGFYVAVKALDFPLTDFTLLAGAFGVGIGFGMQNIVNNFISGLILLFERPIKVGDVVQLGDTAGTVEHIGIRASIIRALDSSEVIVPNGNLLSTQLTNWTLSNRQRGVEISLSAASSADPKRVMGILTGAAIAHPLVLKSPGPEAFLVKIGGDAFGYELHAWTDAAEQWIEIRSDLAVAINQAMTRENIAIK